MGFGVVVWVGGVGGGVGGGGGGVRCCFKLTL